MAAGFCDHSGKQAVVGQSRDYWLDDKDFVSSNGASIRELSCVGFPREWPAAYSSSKALKGLIGKKGSCPAVKAGVVVRPSDDERRQVLGDQIFQPCCSFANAESLAGRQGLSLVHGWAIFEQLDKPPSEAYIAERHWWNAWPDGKWVDFTPWAPADESILLAEAADGAPKQKSVLSAESAELIKQLLAMKKLKPQQIATVACPVPAPSSSATKPTAAAATAARTAAPAATAAQPAKAQAAKPLDYSKWSKIDDSDDDGENGAAQPPAASRPLHGVKDLSVGAPEQRPAPVPDHLLGGSIGGGGASNCLTTMCRLLDKSEEGSDNMLRLIQSFRKLFHCALLDKPRQSFYKQALEKLPQDTFVVVLGVGSLLPMLRVAMQGNGVLLEHSAKLCALAKEVLKVNKLSLKVVHVADGLDKEEAMRGALQSAVPVKTKSVAILTEQFAPDLLSSGIVPMMVTADALLRKITKPARVIRIPNKIELFATPMEVRSERIGEFDIRTFNCFRNTSWNDKADFWWFPVRLDSQENVSVAVLGPSETLCGFDFDRCPEIGLEQVRRQLSLRISKRGRCNTAALWWSARFEDLEYSTAPEIATGEANKPSSSSTKGSGKHQAGGEWKQAVHYLGGETAVFVGDTIDLAVSITPCFTVRMLQESPFSAEVPAWVQAPLGAHFSPTLPLLPYHFVMMQDEERLRAYSDAIRKAIRQMRRKHGSRRLRVLDAGSGIGLLSMVAACEGCDVWACEAVPLMRRVSLEVLAANASMIAEKQGLVQLLPPKMSTQLQVGVDVPEKFDIVIAEVMDVWGLGEGVIPTMRHACTKLLRDDGVMLPSRLAFYVQPLDLAPFNAPSKQHKLSFTPIDRHFPAKFSPMRIAQFDVRWLCDEPVKVLDIDLHNIPPPPRQGEPNLEGTTLCIRMGGQPALTAQVTQVPVEHSGTLTGYGLWWSADLGNGEELCNGPSSKQRSWKQLVRWLQDPRPVKEGEKLQVLSCHSEMQVNLDDLFMDPKMAQQLQEQNRQQAEAAKKNVTDAQPQRVADSAQKANGDDDDDILEVD